MSNLQKIINLAVIAVVIFILAFIIDRSGLMDPLERTLLDTQFRIFQREDPNKKIALISIDEKSLSQFAANGMYWPWPREFYQIVVDYLSRRGADAVVFDILFDTPDFDRINVNGAASDNRFAQSLKKAGNGVLALKTTPATDSTLQDVRADSSLFNTNISGNGPVLTPHRFLSIPIPKFRAATAALGNTNIKGDQDGVIRRVRLFDKTTDGTFVPSLAMSAYLMMQNDSISLGWTDDALRIGDTRIPLQENGTYLINWYKKGGVADGTFPYYSFWNVVQSAIADLRGSGRSTIPDSAFKDKTVFIGASAAGLADIKSTPLSSLEDFPGMEIIATVFNNLFDKNFIGQPGIYLTYGLTLLIVLLIVASTSYFTPLKGTIYSAGIFAALIAAEIFLFTIYRYWLPLGLFLSTGFIAFTTSLGYKYFTEEREKKKLKSAFNHYVQPELVEKIVTQRDSLSLGGEKRNLTVMFSDLAGFTSLSETLEPEELVSIMNDYLGEMTDIIFDHHGTVDKFIGDAIMAFWGAPLEQKNHAIHSCRATLHMIRKLNELNEQWQATGRPELRVRFGINTGEMIVGNMGSKNRFNYTVIGDSVNLAARLEPLNNLFGTTVLISESTFKSLHDEFVCRQAGRFIVKGKTEPVTVFELLADRVLEDTSGMEEFLLIHRESMRLYYDRKWKMAKDKFEQILETQPKDGLVKTYVDYCTRHLKNPPDNSWNGTFKMMHK